MLRMLMVVTLGVKGLGASRCIADSNVNRPGRCKSWTQDSGLDRVDWILDLILDRTLDISLDS